MIAVHRAHRRVRVPLRRRAAPALARLLGVGLVLATGLAQAAPAQQWLARMQDALRELDYQGEFSYFRDGRLSSLSLAHAIIDGEQHERLVHLDGPFREIVRQGEAVLCVLAADDPMLDHLERVPAGPFARAFLPGDGAFADGIPDRYHAIAGGSGRVADLPAIRIEVRPDDGSRYGYRLWLHEESALPLRAELLAENDAPLELFQFVTLRIGTTPDAAALAPSSDPALVRHALERTAPQASVERADWEAAWLPVGFEMAASAARPMREPATARASVQTLRYSDGLASLSVFVEPARGQASWGHSRQQGATSAVMRELLVPGVGRYLVTVVGEVPMGTAIRVADAVRPLGEAAGAAPAGVDG